MVVETLVLCSVTSVRTLGSNMSCRENTLRNIERESACRVVKAIDRELCVGQNVSEILHSASLSDVRLTGMAHRLRIYFEASVNDVNDEGG